MGMAPTLSRPAFAVARFPTYFPAEVLFLLVPLWYQRHPLLVDAAVEVVAAGTVAAGTVVAGIAAAACCWYGCC